MWVWRRCYSRMQWIVLDLNCASQINAQVDAVIDTYTTLQRLLSQRGTSNPLQITRALEVLRHSFSDRLEEMATFYQENDLDPRSGNIEMARLKLKRFLHSVECSNTRRGQERNSFVAPPSDNPASRPARDGPSRETVEADAREQEPDRDSITIRVFLTEEEYSEIIARREALRQLKLDSVLNKR